MPLTNPKGSVASDLPASGVSLTGTQTLTNKTLTAPTITNAAVALAGNPVNPLDATPKQYVDALTGALPAQAGQAGKFLTTSGTTASWSVLTDTVFALTGTVIDPANGTVQTRTLSGNTTFTELINDGQSVVLMLNPSTFTVTWPAISWVTAAGTGAAPTLKASAVNTIVLWQVGGVLYGNWIGSL